MTGPRTLLALLLAALTPWPCPAQQRGWTADPLPYTAAAAPREEPDFAFATTPIAGAIGLEPLHTVSLPPDTREVRLWLGFGLVMPHELVRITSTPDGVDGAVVRWWEARNPPDSDSVFAGFNARMREAAGRYGCNVSPTGMRWRVVTAGDTAVHRGWVWACRADHRGAEPDWAAVLERLDRMGALTLPQSTDDMGHDGISVEVEVLTGDDFHTYTYWHPDLQPGPEAEVATRVMELIRSLSALP